MEMIKDGKDANEALEAAKGNYGRFNDAAKYIDPKKRIIGGYEKNGIYFESYERRN